MTSPARQPDRILLPARVSTSISISQEEHGKQELNNRRWLLPRWVRYAATALHLIVASSSITVIALVAHSLRIYFDTRNIKFGGINASWPRDLNLAPEYFFLVVASLSLAVSGASSLYSFVRRNSPSFSVVERASTVVAMILAVLWIAADALQHQSRNTPKKDVLMWSCRRSESPTNTLVSYASICTEQEAIKYLAILITVTEVLVVACLLGTYRVTRTVSKKLDKSFT